MVFLDVPDLDEDFKNLIAAQASIMAIATGGIAFQLNAQPNYPVIRVYRAGGGKQPGEAQVLDVRFAIEVLHNQSTKAGFLAVRQITGLLESFIDNLTFTQQGGTVFLNGIVTSVVPKPDPNTGWPGKVLDCLMTLRSATQ